MTTEFLVLGPTEVLDGGRAVEVGPPRQRTILAVLLAEANRVVTVDQLVDRVWGHAQAPANPLGALRTYVSLLRRALSAVEGVALVRQSSGYKAVVDERNVDLYRFRDLLAHARTAAADDRAAALLREALALWRGEPFTGLDTPWINSVRQGLIVRHQAARLDLTELRLRLGQHAGLLDELTQQADEHPLDERIAGQLILTLYRSGRQADALARYRRIRGLLTDEVGTDPGPELRRLHQQILVADPALAAPAPRPTASAARPPAVPRQLPAAPRLFVGRERELEFLSAALSASSGSGATLVITAIGGAGGIGKTWLALHWAHRNAERFPDGQLYVNLSGFDPSGAPTPPQTAVRGFLDALGVTPAAIPPDPEAQFGLYRSLVADKRLLIVLDNARDAGQVASLVPGGAACTVLVTSRHHLGGLVTAHGARTVDLGVFSEPEARAVLVRHLGEQRVAAEPQAVADLLAGCAGLPLALGIVAARAGRHPGFPLAALAAELRDESRRLDALDPGGSQATLRAVLSWSTVVLSEGAASAFGLLGLAPGPDIGLPAAAGLLGRDTGAAMAALRELEDASLVQQHAPGRYRMHDLVRLYAVGRAQDGGQAARSAEALRRLVDFYLHTALAGDRLMDAHRPDVTAAGADAEPGRPLHDAAEALAWFTDEHANLLAGQRLAAERDWPEVVWQLAWALDTFHWRRGHVHDALAVWGTGLAAIGDRLADPAVEILVRRRLGHACAVVGAHASALAHLDAALVLATRDGDTASQAHIHHSLAWALEQQGEDQRALEHAVRALSLYRKLDSPIWEARELNAVGWYNARVGDYEQAFEHCQAALTVTLRHGHQPGEANTLDSLGYICFHTGRYELAEDYYTRALAVVRDLGHTYLEAETLERLGHTHAARHRHAHARLVWQQAHRLFEAQHRTVDAARLQEQLDSIGEQDRDALVAAP